MPNVRFYSAISRFALFSGVLFSFTWAVWGPEEQIGISMQQQNGMVRVSAGSSPQAVAMGVFMLLIYCLVLNSRVTVHEFRVAPIWRRASAFAVDFWFVVFSLGSLSGGVAVLLEASRTGVFRWQFERNYWVGSDRISVGLVFVGMAAFIAYFLLPLMRRGQTVGSWIFRVVTVNTDGCLVYLPFKVAIRRLIAGFRGLGSPLRTIRKRDEQGRTFYDIESGFTVVCY